MTGPRITDEENSCLENFLGRSDERKGGWKTSRPTESEDGESTLTESRRWFNDRGSEENPTRYRRQLPRSRPKKASERQERVKGRTGDGLGGD